MNWPKRMYKRHLLTNQKKTIVSICQGKKEMVKCKVEKYVFLYYCFSLLRFIYKWSKLNNINEYVFSL